MTSRLVLTKSAMHEVAAHPVPVPPGGGSGIINHAMRILLIEDDTRLLRLEKQVLEEEGHTVDTAADGDTGLELALRGVYDVAVIDWMLPGRDGPAICRAVRGAHLPTALLLLTARTQVEDRVAGLDSGADDYLSKPFAFDELLARVRALSRRFLSPAGDTFELRAGDLVMDLRAHTARRADVPLELSATEWKLLEYLMRHPGQSLTREQILDYVWSFDCEVQPTMVDVYISYVRTKLRNAGLSDAVETVRGVGYRLRA
jgi:two-component system OmpR family response regulator